MKKLIYSILTVCFLAGGITYAEGDRVKIERERFERETERLQIQMSRANIRGIIRPTKITPIDMNFRPSKQAQEADKLAYLEITYPLAFSRYKKLEDFSYFGFKKYDVETGRLSFEDFLKELNEYLLIHHN